MQKIGEVTPPDRREEGWGLPAWVSGWAQAPSPAQLALWGELQPRIAQGS